MSSVTTVKKPSLIETISDESIIAVDDDDRFIEEPQKENIASADELLRRVISLERSIESLQLAIDTHLIRVDAKIDMLIKMNEKKEGKPAISLIDLITMNEKQHTEVQCNDDVCLPPNEEQEIERVEIPDGEYKEIIFYPFGRKICRSELEPGGYEAILANNKGETALTGELLKDDRGFWKMEIFLAKEMRLSGIIRLGNPIQ